LSQFTRLTDGRTDGQTEFSSQDHVCMLQRGKNTIEVSGEGILSA